MDNSLINYVVKLELALNESCIELVRKDDEIRNATGIVERPQLSAHDYKKIMMDKVSDDIRK